MQGDLISRSAALDIINEERRFAEELRRSTLDSEDRAHNMGQIGCAIGLARKIKDLPAVDAVPVVHASWVSEVVTKKDWKGRTNHYYQPCSCSACHEPAFREYKYCPYCGARMDGDADESE